MDLRRTKRKFTREQRLAIIEEYEKGTLTGKEIAQKYGFRSPSLIFNWRERLLNPRQHLRNSEKSSIFAAEIAPQVADDVPMKKQTPEELEALKAWWNAHGTTVTSTSCSSISRYSSVSAGVPESTPIVLPPTLRSAYPISTQSSV